MRATIGVAVLLAGQAVAGDVPANSPLKPICDFLCGTWEQEDGLDQHGDEKPPAPDPDAGMADHFALELHWDAASGELRGTHAASGGPNGSVHHELVFRVDPESKEIVLITAMPEYSIETRSQVDLENTQLRVFSVTPGNPTVTSTTLWSFVEEDRMIATRAESASGYNYFFGDVMYRKVK